MPFVVKATYRNETRKFTFNSPYFPSYEELYHQLYRVFVVGHSYYLSKLLFSPQGCARILIGMEAHSAAEYNNHIAPYKGHLYPNGRLIFSVYDETPHKVAGPRVTASGSFLHPIPPAPPTPFFAPPSSPRSRAFLPPRSSLNPIRSSPHSVPAAPPRNPSVSPRLSSPPMLMNVIDDSEYTPKQDATMTTDTPCCSVAQGKREVKSLMDNFLRDFNRIMGSNFGEDASFLGLMGSPSIQHGATPGMPTPPPAVDLDASLPIPGSFIQPRPHSLSALLGGAYVEKSQGLPRLEPLQMLHPDIWCNFCGDQINGLRFNCQECVDYDLCATCIVANQALDKHNADQLWIHRFSTIIPPTPEVTVPSVPIAPIAPIVPQRQRACSTVPGVREPVVHDGISCDMCEETVIGDRHKCLDCPDYDLCDNCIGNAETQHPFHQFLKLETPGRVVVHTVNLPTERRTSPIPHHARCNLCDSRIIGDRYKCTDCPDFDTCASCFAIIPEHHPFHVFVKVALPSDIMCRPNAEPVHHFASCNGCSKHIVGVRYKCMHAECPDFDLCQDCEALPIPVHPATHPFLKIKSVETCIPNVQRRTPNVYRSVARRALSPPICQVLDVPDPVPAGATVSSPTPAVSPTPSMSDPVERLHAIRVQAERLRSAQIQQLQSHSFIDEITNPIIEEHLITTRKEAEDQAQLMDKELEAHEKARQKKHEDRAEHSCPPYLESVQTAFADQPEVYQSILKRLIEYFCTKDATLSQSIAHQVHTLLAGQPALLEGLEDFLANDHVAPEVPTSTSGDLPPLEQIAVIPEMTQRKSVYFGCPFIHPVESPLQAYFISDNNIPDGHIFPAGAEYVKSWRLRNTGVEAWAEGTEVVFVGGMRLGAFEGAPTAYDVGHVSPGKVMDVCAGDMKAPEIPGQYISYWRLRDPQGRQFGPKMWCEIEVLEIESDHSQHGSLVNSAVVMPETAPEQAPSVGVPANLLSRQSSPITVPSSAVTMSDSASTDGSSTDSASLVGPPDSDWDEIEDVPSLHRQSAAPREVNVAGDEIEYQVLYDSASEEA